MRGGNASSYVLSRLRQGYYTFSLADAERTLGPGDSTRQAMYRLVRQGWLVSLSNGFYIIIDPQHQVSGFVPVEWFIDDWMRFLKRRYYIGMLSAAALHGASHQKPQQVQVVLDGRLQPVSKGAYHIAFFYKKMISEVHCRQEKSPAGYFSLSDAEMTAYDLLRYPRACPSLDLAATVLGELGEAIAPNRLASLVSNGAETAVLQRLGWLLDHTGWSEKTDLLSDALRSRKLAWRTLRTDSAARGSRDARWHIIVNATVEADL